MKRRRQLQLVKQHPGVISAAELFVDIEATNNRRAVAYLRAVLRAHVVACPGHAHPSESQCIGELWNALRATEPRKLAGHTKRRGVR